MKKINHITLADVCKAAGVSLNTAAKVLAGQAKKARISEKTAKKVKKVAQSLDYVPNQMARSLRAKKTSIIGIFVADMIDPIYAAITHSILEELPKHNLFPLLTVAEAGYEMCRQTWLRNRIDGLIFCGTTPEMTPQAYSNLEKNNIRIVIAGNYYLPSGQSAFLPQVSLVHIDNHAGMQLIINHLIELKKQKIAFITGPKSHSDAKDRLQAYEYIIREHQNPIIADLQTDERFWQRGYLAIKQLFEQEVKCDGIIAYDDLVAIGAIKFLHQNGINIPNDIAVVGFDNLPQAEYSTPPITSLEQPAQAIGQRSVELLVKHLAQENKIEHVHMIPALIPRESTSTSHSQIAHKNEY
ncbi:MAG: HTH-type transcriptional regulator DegA [Planctomycetes bacterium ADurb.Bin401]|nr:MAG: HTH-type transcriptional regulator DegA [Planctomycetes bacterium ADurb.Bin401]